MIKKILSLLFVLFILCSCDDNTLELGYSIVPKQDELSISAKSFNVSSRTVVVDSVLAKTGAGYIGKYRDLETGAYITQNFLSQINMLEGVQLDSIENMYKEDGKVVSDSCFIRLYIDEVYGDSLNLMKMTCYELAKPLAEEGNYYTNFDIENPSFGYLRKDGIKVERAWVADDLYYSDSVRSDLFGRFIITPLNDTYKSLEGKTYKNYGTYILQTYYEHPEYFKNSYEFNHHVCPGFYFKNTNGVGTIAKIKLTDLSIYYRYKTQVYDTIQHQKKDTLTTRINIFYGTNEVRQLTQINNDMQQLKELSEDNTCTYLKTPAGLFTEITLPIEEIFVGHEFDSLNITKLTLERYNSTIEDNEFAPLPPNDILLIQKDNLKDFFEKSAIVDSETSFLAKFNSTNNIYTFTDISRLITSMYQAKKAGKANEDWNKALIIPVSVWNDVNVSHLMDMTSTRLVGGSQNPTVPIQLQVTYSSFNK